MLDPATIGFMLNVFVCANAWLIPESCATAAVYNYGPYDSAEECRNAVPRLQPRWDRLEAPGRYGFECFAARIR